MSSQLTPLASSILSYLAQGLTATQTARALNCSESYISDLMTDESFVSRLREKQAESLETDNSIDAKRARIENKLLDGIEASLPLLIDPMKKLHAYRVINSGKRHSIAPNATSQNIQQTVVQLQLPPALLGKFTLNSQNQVIEAGGQTLVTMHPHELDKLREQKLGAIENDSTTPTPLAITKIDEFGFEHVSK